ncbi:hypothetical protein JCM11641_004102 [Rhodosporidiobolus odoratus]
MAATINALPFELVEQILQLAVADVDLSSSSAAISSRATFVRQCSLVSRTFRSPAQAVLWSSLRIQSPVVARRLLASPVLGQYGTHELDLVGVHAGVEGLSGSTASRVLGKLRGIQWLRLADFGRLSGRVLQNRNLAGLRILILMTSFPDKPATLSALTFPFHLRSLSLYNRSYPPSFLSRLFTTSAHSLRSLTLLTGSSSPTYYALVACFPRVAPNLRHLSLQHRPSPALVEQFAVLTSLSHLECHFAVDLPAVLDALPSPSTGASALRHLTIELDYNLAEMSTTLVERLQDSASVLSGLKKLSIPRAPAPQDFREFGGQRLLELCEEKGVDVEIGAVVAWRTRSLLD